MGKISDSLHWFPVGDFVFSGELNEDIRNYVDREKISLYNQDLDENNFIFILYRLSFGRKIIVHTLTDGVVGKVKHTKIENIPNEIPEYMKQPFLFEAQHDKILFDNIRSIGGFIYNDEMFLIIGTQDDRFYCQREKSSFDGRKIDEINFIYNKEVNYGSFINYKKRKDTFAFATTLSLMLEAERTPFLIDNKNCKKKNVPNGIRGTKNESDWIIKRIYIDKNIKYKNTSSDKKILDKDGKWLKDVNVTGFLRKQRYGRGLSETKWIYIDSFESKRWTSEKNTRIIVDIYDEKSM